MKERLILVTSFEELRAGMIVVAVCAWCPGRHRGILGEFDGNRTTVSARGAMGTGPAYELLPPPPCEVNDRRWVVPRAVAAGRVYRVDDGLEALDKLEKSRSTPKPECVR